MVDTLVFKAVGCLVRPFFIIGIKQFLFFVSHEELAERHCQKIGPLAKPVIGNQFEHYLFALPGEGAADFQSAGSLPE